MCGRYSLSISPENIAAWFNFHPSVETIPPRFNIAPTQTAPVVRLDRDGNPEWVSLRWGLVPRWSKDLASGSKMINARSETVAERPAFRDAFRKRRCLVPATGFYEWQKLDARNKQPFYIYHHDGQPLVMAGLWESWKQQDEMPPIETFTILTTEANLTIPQKYDPKPVERYRQNSFFE